MFNEYEVTEAAPSSTADFHIVPTTFDENEDPDEQRHPAWKAADDDWTVVIADSAPDEAIDLVESQGYEAVWEHEVNRERIKRVELDVREEVAYYLEEPPAERFQAVGRRRAIELLDRRGIEGEHKESWWYPEKEEFVAVLTRVDDSGSVNRMIWRADNLSSAERGLILDGESLDNEEEQTLEQRGQEIYEHSPFGERESEVLAGIERNLIYSEIARQLDISASTVQTVKCNIKKKWQGFRWIEDEGLDELLDDVVCNEYKGTNGDRR